MNIDSLAHGEADARMKVVLWKGFAFSEEEEGRRRGVIVVVTTSKK